MLKKFSVTNFKNFEEKITFDLGQPKNYKFNTDCIKNGNVKNAIIYGKNASGKTNLILAIFDITNSLTDHNRMQSQYSIYRNLFCNITQPAKFEYEFDLNGNSVKYTCEKTDKSTFISEQLSINNSLIIDRQPLQSKFKINLPGLDSFDNTLSDNNLSAIKYVYRNTKIKDFNDEVSRIFVAFMNFVEKMLMFYSLHERDFIGFQGNPVANIFRKTIENNKVKDFENFLKRFEFDYELVETKNAIGEPSLSVKFGQQLVEFFHIASSGVRALALFYFWHMDIDEISLLVIDEFDAFYNNTLSKKIVKVLIDSGCQVILTTHNTSIMTNELMRPDCYFRINKTGISSLADIASNKIELREAHNLEKIYQSGWFDE